MKTQTKVKQSIVVCKSSEDHFIVYRVIKGETIIKYKICKVYTECGKIYFWDFNKTLIVELEEILIIKKKIDKILK